MNRKTLLLTSRLHNTNRSSPGVVQSRQASLSRVASARVIGVVGLVLYNWWIFVAVKGTLLTSSGEFFSDLEATGRPDANLLQHLDLAAGVIGLVALVLRGPWGPTGKRPEWRWLLAFSVAGAIGGQFAYACSEGFSAACRRAEWHLELPLHHYVHILAGIVEFAMMTIAVYLAQKRTRGQSTWIARITKWTYVVLVSGYPVLAVAYLSDEWGAYVEPIFFVCFSVMIIVELFESSRNDSQLATN